MSGSSGVVMLNGRMVGDDDVAAFVADDAGARWGDGVFETWRVFGGVGFRRDAHLARLGAGAASVGFAAPPPDALAAACDAALDASGLVDAVVRLVVTRGPAGAGFAPAACGPPTVLVTVRPAPRDDAPGPGVTLVTVPGVRDPLAVPAPTVKSASFQWAVAARVAAVRAGADEALVCAPDATIAEASAANIFAVVGATLHTPAPGACLAGITRAAVLELAPAAGVSVVEAPLPAEVLAAADEVFVTNSGGGVRWVRAVDGRVIGGAAGPVTARLADAYRALVADETAP